ncbi:MULTISPECIES: signal peptidase I [Metallosphaera]|nr:MULTISPECIES: signal peptidase I [Metallosphaera]AKV74654.1 peptidase S26 [Metallosphaera sedula]AKV76891.1 peptidase S26 [Metallosphaera sedula]AKV79142.1 peptidase S26 [Metallosphaera sedula]AKV81387.1 peptidase S26 [Metallosphaera sedula]AKV83622.1 peptidase S26 [Metallosphaera sedula]
MWMKKSDIAIIILIALVYIVFYSNIVSSASVEGVSMYPIFQNGALTFYQSPTHITYHSIIIYRSPQLHTYVIHRVIRVDGTYYVTQGVDKISNPQPDNQIGLEPAPGVPSSDVIGKVTEIDGYVISIPYLGYLSILLSSLAR